MTSVLFVKLTPGSREEIRAVVFGKGWVTVLYLAWVLLGSFVVVRVGILAEFRVGFLSEAGVTEESARSTLDG
jgi:hypothetical protein